MKNFFFNTNGLTQKKDENQLIDKPNGVLKILIYIITFLMLKLHVVYVFEEVFRL